MLKALVFCVFLAYLPNSESLTNTGELLSQGWGQFWSASCQFSTIVSRTRRSIELPNLSDPVATFEYLFPNANARPEDVFGESSRSSSSSTPTLSSWLDDALDLWTHECQRRHKKESKARRQRNQKRQKRSNVRNQGVSTTTLDKRTGEVEDPVITWAGYLGNLSSSLYTSSQHEAGSPSYNPLSFLNTDYFSTTITYPDQETDQEALGKKDDDDEDADDDSGSEKSNYDKDKYKDENAEEEEEAGDEDEDDSTDETTTDPDDETTTVKSTDGDTTTTTTTTTTTAAPAEEDPYFSSYGGDIEYFFPILSFTIPFDGEITLLGFHGFKGMFVY